MTANVQNKIKVIALFGPSASGKDTLLKEVINNADVHEVISCTTRPPRDYEKDGVNYHFLSNEKFAEKVLDGSMLEATSFRGWFYGTPLESLDKDKINIAVFNIQGIECLLKDNRIDLYPIYIACEDKLRLLRSLEREKNPDCEEICRRFLTDAKDFESIDFEYYTYYNGYNIKPGVFTQYLSDHGLLKQKCLMILPKK